MAPILTELTLFGRTLPVYGYGAMLALAVAVGTLGLLGLAFRRGWDVGGVIACVGAGLMAGAVGAHGLFLLVAAAKGEPVAPLVGQGGIVFLGGALGGALGVAAMARLFAFPLLSLLDLAVAPLALAHAVGRVGCMLGGCCYGAPHDGLFSVAYSHPLAPVHDGIPRHPVQLYEAGGLLVLAVALSVVPEKARPGTRLGAYLVGYAVLRGATETFRGDTLRGVFFDGWLSTSQIVAVALLIGGLYLLFRQRARRCTPSAS